MPSVAPQWGCVWRCHPGTRTAGAANVQNRGGHTIVHRPSLAHHLFFFNSSWAKNDFYLFQWLEKNQKENILWLLKNYMTFKFHFPYIKFHLCTAMLFIYVLFMVVFWLQSLVIATEIRWPTIPKTFLTWDLYGKSWLIPDLKHCWLLHQQEESSRVFHEELKAWYESNGLPWRLSSKESSCQCRRCMFNPWLGKILWRRKWQPTPVFLPGRSQGQKSLVGYSPWGCKDQTQLSN